MSKLTQIIFENCIAGKIDEKVGVELLKILKESPDKGTKDVAIIGISARTPQAKNVKEFWSNIRDGRNSICSFPEARKKDSKGFVSLYTNINEDNIDYCQGGYLDEVDKFDYNFFRLSPKEASIMDPNQRAFLEVAWEAIEDAGYGGTKLCGSNTGVYLGYSNWPAYGQYISKKEPSLASIGIPGNLPSIIASRISYLLDLKGPSILVDTACSSSLVAVNLAYKSICSGECEFAIAGGVKISLFPVKGLLEAGIESSNNKTNTFDDKAEGTVWGEGVAAILMKPLQKAIQDRDTIYAVIKGSAINQDGSSVGITAPNMKAQEDVILSAWKDMGVDPETISYIEAHGTGTKLGDPIEIEAISKAFSRYTSKKQFCGVGSVKPNIGHLDSASGIVGLIKLILALKHREMPPSINFNRPNKGINFIDSPVYVNNYLREWEPSEGIRRAGISAFGFSGTNCHIVVEEAPQINAEIEEKDSYILALSAKTRESLNELVAKYKNYINSEQFNIGDLCYTATTGRGHYEYRMVMIIKHFEDLKGKLNILCSLFESKFESDGIFFNRCKVVVDSKKSKEEGQFTESEVREACLKASDLMESLSESRNDEEYLKQICKLYCMGAEINWEKFYSSGNYRKINLPVYPFKKDRCWIEFTEENNDTNIKTYQSSSPDIETIISFSSFASRLPKNANCLITNGLSSTGLNIARYLSEKTKGKLILSDSKIVIPQNEKEKLLPISKFAGLAGFKQEKECITFKLQNEINNISLVEKTLEKEIGTLVLSNDVTIKEKVDHLCASYILEYFRDCGINTSIGSSFTRNELKKSLNILDKYERFFNLFIRILTEDKFIVANYGRFEFIKNYEETRPSYIIRDSITEERPEFKGILNLLDHCVSNYKRALSGEIEAIGVLYPGGSSQLVEGSYKDTENYSDRKLYVKLLSSIVNNIVKKSEGKKVRILEIGAGNGVLTEEIIYALDNKEIEYYFTDIGKFFLVKGEQKAQSKQWKFMRFGLLDISRDPVGQGYEENSFDIILGLDVVHATRDISESLGNLKKLLNSNGVLMLLEIVKNHRWIDMIWGLADGWWYFEDAHRRSESPLMSIEKWQDALEEEGFPNIAAYPLEKNRRLNFDSGLIIGQNDSYVKENLIGTNHSEYIGSIVRDLRDIENLGGQVNVLCTEINQPKEFYELLDSMFSYSGELDGVIDIQGILGSGKLKFYDSESYLRAKNINSNANNGSLEVVSGNKLITGITLKGKESGIYTETESQIAQIWSSTLGLKEIDVYDTFYDLGGDSIIAMNISGRIEKDLGIKINVSDVFQYSTIVENSAFIDEKYPERTVNTLADDGEEVIEVQIDAENLYKPFPLTDVQNAYLMGRDAQFEMGGISTRTYIELETELDIEKLNLSLIKLIHRHNMLRAVILPTGEQQFMEEVPEYSIEVIDIRHLNADDQEEYIATHRKTASNNIFDIGHWPMFEFKAFKVSESKHYVFVGLDALVVDGASTQIICSELIEFYKNPDLSMTQLEFTFRDYVLAYQQLRNSQRYKEDKKYWMGKLDGFYPAAKLPLKINPENIVKPRFKRYSKLIENDIWDRIKNICRKNNVTYSTLLSILYAEVLAFWSNQPKLTINLTVFNRFPFHQDVYKIVGDFTSLLLLDIDLESSKSFWVRAKNVQDTMINALAHRSYDGVEFIREIVKYNNLNITKAVMPIVFTSMLVNDKENRPNNLKEIGNVRMGVTQTPQVYIDNQAIEIDGCLSITWDYAEELFEEKVIESMFRQFIGMLESISIKGDIESLRPCDRDKLFIKQYNNSKEEIKPEMLHRMFIEQAKLTPDNIAVICEDQKISYRELDEKSNQIANYLAEHGVNKGDFVGVLGVRCIDSIINILGILKLGAAYIPIGIDFPEQRKKYIIESSGCKLLLEPGVEIDTYDKDFVPCVDDYESIAYVIYTSGSTGAPKGVIITHGAVSNTIIDMNRKFKVNERDRILGLSSYCFDLSVYDVFGPLSSGAALVIVTDQKDAKIILKNIQEHHITIWNSVPAIMELLIESLKEDSLNHTLRLVLLSGDWIPVKQPDRIKKYFRNSEIISLGGATEVSIWSIYYPIKHVEKEWKSIPYGIPLANQELYVLNYNMDICPVDVPGEIYIGGVGLAKGYLNDEERTRDLFIKHPQLGSLYKTGDHGILRKDGFIEFLGRMDNQVKIRGYRIELGEIESCIAKYNDIQNAIVLVKQNYNSSKYLCAFFTSDKKIEVSDLKNFVRNKLPDYMVPLHFIQIEDIPLTQNGKVNRSKLLEYKIILEPEEQKETGKPRNLIEEKLVTIWSDILGIENIGINDNFFDLGGDSLVIQRIKNRIEKAFNQEVSIRDLFNEPTISEIATKISSKTIYSGKQNRVLTKSVLSLDELFGAQDNLFISKYGEEILYVPEELEKYKKTQLNRIVVENGGIEICLDPFGEFPENITGRRTHRSFDEKNRLQFGKFSYLVSILKQVREKDAIRYNYASAGGLYPIDVYIYIKEGRIEGISKGLYYYSPIENKLIMLTDDYINIEDANYIGNKTIAKSSAFSIYFVFNAEANMPKYGYKGYYYALIDTGIMVSTLTQAAEQCSIGLCSVGDMEFEKIKPWFNLSENQIFFHVLEGGLKIDAIDSCTHENSEELYDKYEIQVQPYKEYYPVSSAQKRIFILSQFEDGNLSYNTPAAIWLNGTIEIRRFERAFKKLVERHEILRTSFVLVDGKPMQKISANLDFDIHYIETTEDKIDDIIKEFIRPFKMDTAPLMRISLLKLAEEKNIVLFDLHHIITDWTSTGILIQEFAKLYKGEELPELRIQYKDFSVWQNKMILKSLEIKKQEKYWIDKFKDGIPILEMPLDFIRPHLQSYEGERINCVIDKQLVLSVKRFSKESGNTLYMVLLGVINVLLSKYTGQEDIVIGTPIAGREHADLENLIGMFLNTLAIRNFPKGDMMFEEFLEEVKNNALRAYENQDYQFEELVSKLNVSRDTGRNPLFDVMFVLQENWQKDIVLDNLIITPYDTKFNVSRFDITINVIENEGELNVEFEYCTKLYKQSTINRMAKHFINILRNVLANPKSKIADIQIASKEDIEEIYMCNESVKDYPCDKTIGELFLEQVGLSHDSTAVIFQDKKLTYKELNDKSNSLARAIRERSTGDNPIIGIIAERSLEVIIGIMGIIKAGGAYLPIDPTYPSERIRYMLEDSGVTMLLMQSGTVYSADEFKGDILLLDDERTYDKGSSNIEIINKPNDLAYVIYTSGTTGNPKGVLIEHRSVINISTWFNSTYDLKSNKNVLQIANYTFDVSVEEIIVTLLNGATIFIPEKEIIFDRKSFGEFITKHQINIAQFVPSLLKQLLLIQERLESLRVLICGGERLDDELKDQILSKGYQLYNHYGPTEATVDAITTKCKKSVSVIGKPVANTRIYILDKDKNLQPVGVAGELCIAGDGLARGYLNSSDLNGSKFDTLCFEENDEVKEERIYYTGDMARWLPDGNIEFLGRKDYQVKIRGFRIELEEIENCINSIETVKSSVVSAREDKVGNKYLCAYIIGNGELNLTSIRESLKGKLPEYMIPSYFMQIEKIPLTSNGKVDRKSLPDINGHTDKISEFKEPTNETTYFLAELWQKLLDRDRIGINDNFFEVGGDSLILIEMFSKLESKYKGKITVADVFAYPTIERLAKFIDDGEIITSIDVKGINLPEEYFCVGDEFCTNETFGFDFDHMMQERLKVLAGKFNVVIRDILLSSYIYLLREMSEDKEINVFTAINSKSELSTFTIDMDAINDLGGLFTLVNEMTEKDKETFPIEAISKIRNNPGDNLVIPLFYTGNSIESKYLKKFDIILRLNEGVQALGFAWDYNSERIKTEKVEQMVHAYIRIIEVLLEKYT